MYKIKREEKLIQWKNFFSLFFMLYEKFDISAVTSPFPAGTPC